MKTQPVTTPRVESDGLRRLRLLRECMEHVRDDAAKKLNMHKWVLVHNECGTTACMAGHGAFYPPLMAEGLYPVWCDCSDADACTPRCSEMPRAEIPGHGPISVFEFFGLREAHSLFCPHSCEDPFSIDEAIQRLDDVIAEKEATE